MKSEPSAFSIDDLKKRPAHKSPWDGVRNYQARNFMRDDMRRGDLAFFYHSSCPEPAIAGIVQVVSEAYPDATQFDPGSAYFDPKATREAPIWWLVDVEFQQKLQPFITLLQLRKTPGLEEMMILRRGSRLSITPVTEEEWRIVEALTYLAC